MIKEKFEKYFHVPRQQSGWPVLAVAGGLTAIASALYLPLGLIGLAGFIYLKIILRMPKRAQPDIKAGQIAAPTDGQILSVASDKTIKVWDLFSYKCVQTLRDESIHFPSNRLTSA
ncbi:MAG: hypothetical protein ACPGHX_08515, partial [Candidatus Puniceispirillaceae bacterium]